MIVSSFFCIPRFYFQIISLMVGKMSPLRPPSSISPFEPHLRCYIHRSNFVLVMKVFVDRHPFNFPFIMFALYEGMRIWGRITFNIILFTFEPLLKKSMTIEELFNKSNTEYPRNFVPKMIY